MKKLHVTHIDLDGISPIVLNYVYKNPLGEVDYLFLNYDEISDKEGNFILLDKQPALEDYDSYVFTDISFDETLYNWLKSTGKEYIIFDHHEASITTCSEDPNCYVDTKRSGTRIYYEYLVNTLGVEHPATKTIGGFVELVDTYDRYVQDSPVWDKAYDLNRIFWGALRYWDTSTAFSKYSKFVDIQVSKFNIGNPDGKPYFFTQYEQGLIEKAIQKEENELTLARNNMKIKTDDRGIKYIVYHGSAKISQTCNSLLKAYPEVEYVINVNTYNGKKPKTVNGKISVRSRESFDVTTLEKVNGHKQAGGGELFINELKKIYFNEDAHLQYQ